MSSYRHSFTCTNVVLLAVEMLLNWWESQPMSVKSLSWQRYLSAVTWQNWLHKWPLLHIQQYEHNDNGRLICVEYLLRLGVKAGSHHWRVAGNSVWSHMACEFPVAVKAKLMLTAIHCLLLLFLQYPLNALNNIHTTSLCYNFYATKLLHYAIVTNSGWRFLTDWQQEHTHTQTHTNEQTNKQTDRQTEKESERHCHIPDQWRHPWQFSTAHAPQQHTAAVLSHCWMAAITTYSTRTSSSMDQHRGTTTGHADLQVTVHNIEQT